MGNLGALDIFVRVGETGSFTATSQQLGISPSAVSKAIARLEERLKVRLFHRSTRSIKLTQEGSLFLERCRRILCEVEQAETELCQLQSLPSGRLRVSMPSIGTLFMPKLAIFKRRYPEIELDMDYTDRMVDVIEEGFDAVLRTGVSRDSRLMVRTIGTYRRVMAGSAAYFQGAGFPRSADDLKHHACLRYRFPSTGKLDTWPLSEGDEASTLQLPVSMVTNTLEPLVYFAEQGFGIACVPEIAIRRQLEAGTLVKVLEGNQQELTTLQIVWPSSRHLSPKVRVFVDFMAEQLFPL